MASIYNNRIYQASKKIYYKFLILFNKRKGVRYVVNGFVFRMPVSCFEYLQFRFFPADYEKENFDFFKKVATPNIVCIDIGAHIGLYSVYMCKQASAKVYSFEPTPTSQNVFRDMLRVNHCEDSIQLIPAAVADKSGKTTFYISDMPLNVANSMVQPSGVSEVRKGYEVDVVSIDEFVSAKKIPVHFIKIDAEGVELEVLKGARNTFLKYQPSGILGLHPFAYKHKSETYNQIWDLLEQFRLQVFYDDNLISREAFMSKFGDRNEVFDIQFKRNE